MKKFLILIAILTMFIACFEDPPIRVILPVPYHQWLNEGYCAIACIQMWADYDGHYINQGPIADVIGTWPNPYEVVAGVNDFTNSFGWIEYTEGPDDYNQDLCIAFSIASINSECPSIMPFNSGIHNVLAIGFQWHTTGSGTPIAETFTYHDPNPSQGPELTILGSELKRRFTPSNGWYYTIVGDRTWIQEGIDGYEAFLEAGGRYYGGPSNYHPKPIL